MIILRGENDYLGGRGSAEACARHGGRGSSASRSPPQKSGADGSFGSLTETRVKEYQNKNGLTADGVVGINTWNKLLGG